MASNLYSELQRFQTVSIKIESQLDEELRYFCPTKATSAKSVIQNGLISLSSSGMNGNHLSTCGDSSVYLDKANINLRTERTFIHGAFEIGLIKKKSLPPTQTKGTQLSETKCHTQQIFLHFSVGQVPPKFLKSTGSAVEGLPADLYGSLFSCLLPIPNSQSSFTDK